MAYATYTTDALVCGTFNKNTADRSYLLFTRDAGMLYADARSVREERSKQRFSLTDFSLIRVSLVKGKAGWKIGSVSVSQNFYNEAADKAARGSVVSLFRALRRFLSGEEPEKNLFAFVVEGLETLAGEVEYRAFLEQAIAVRVLAYLGYVDAAKLPAELSEDRPAELANQEPIHEKSLENLYTQAVEASHL